MFNKKAMLFALSLASMALVSCGSGGAGGGGGGSSSADLTYWCPAIDNDVMKEIVEDFKASNGEYKDLVIKAGANYGEGDTYAQLHIDLKAAADVMLMADDNIRAGVKAEEIAEIKDDAFKSEVSADAIAACSVKGKLYGYPYRADNSPMPFYDTKVFTNPDDLKSLETICSVAKAAGKKVVIDLANGWYNAGMLWAGGGDFWLNEQGNGIVTDIAGSKISGVAASLNAFKKLYNQYKTTIDIHSDQGKMEAGFGDKSIAYAIYWNDIVPIKAKNPDVSVTTWPSIKIGENAVNLECFQSYKAVVCKEGENEERVALAKKFARFLASKSAQQKRFEKLSYGPSNLELLASAAVKASPFINAVNEMAAAKRTHPQALNVVQAFWTPMGNLGGLVTNGKETWGEYPNATMALEAMIENTGWNAGEKN